ncbi:MAG: peptidoglycan DD-metalloendopeptidase family protein [Acidobacteriota bacterium]|nr:peptidoglycan DD-metalloendopeptidase family protein [Acidobacteriota bacterium]
MSCLGAGLLYRETARLEAEARSPFPVSVAGSYQGLGQTVRAFVRDAVPADIPLAVPGRIRRGQNLSQVLVELGLDRSDADRATRVAAEHVDLRRLRAGSRYAGYVALEGGLVGFDLHLDGKGRFEMSRDGSGWRGAWREFERSVEVRRASGTLESSLEAAFRASGAPAAAAYEMAEVLQWDVDFNRDLRKGDLFDVVYEEVMIEGEVHGVGNVLAAVLHNGDRRLEAYRFEDGYYDAAGRPLRKLFLRSPLKFSRVTSSFSSRRFHPILKKYRPHYGVDYGAPTGTPVRVTASGVVASAKATQGGGRTVSVRHPNDYVTHYLHLSRYGEGVGSGRRVVQGDVIGFVGATGLATAPHLDYRVQLAGRWINPANLKNEPAPPLAEAELASFVDRRDALRAGLELFYGAPAAGSQLAAAASSASAGGR